MTESLARIQANEREIAELREQLTTVTNYSRWLANLVSRLSQRIGVIEYDAHISQLPQRNTVIRGLDENEQRLVTNGTDDVTTSAQARSHSQTA